MFCPKCGHEAHDDAVVCTSCGRMLNGKELSVKTNETDKVSLGFCILAFLSFWFGITFWACKKDQTPKKAKACGLTAIITFGVKVALVVAFVLIFVSMLPELMVMMGL